MRSSVQAHGAVSEAERILRVEPPPGGGGRENELFIDSLLVRINLIIEMILVDWPCAMEV